MNYTLHLVCLLLMGVAAREKQIKLDDIERDNLQSERQAKDVKYKPQQQAATHLPQAHATATPANQMQYGFVPINAQNYNHPQYNQGQTAYVTARPNLQYASVTPQYVTAKPNPQYVSVTPRYVTEKPNLQYVTQQYATVTEAYPQTQPEYVQQTQYVQQSNYAQIYAKPNLQTYTQMYSQAKPDSQAYTQLYSQAKPDSQAYTQFNSQSKPDSQAYTQFNSQSKPDSQAYTQMYLQSKPDSQQLHAQAKQESYAYAQLYSQPKPHTQAYTQSKLATQEYIQEKPQFDAQAYTQAFIQPKPQYVSQVAYEQPTYEQPAYKQATYEQPAYKQATYEQPANKQATYEQPTYKQPTYEQPAYKQGTYEQPANKQATYEQPANKQATYEQPAYKQASYEQPAHEYATKYAPQPGVKYVQPAEQQYAYVVDNHLQQTAQAQKYYVPQYYYVQQAASNNVQSVADTKGNNLQYVTYVPMNYLKGDPNYESLLQNYANDIAPMYVQPDSQYVTDASAQALYETQAKAATPQKYTEVQYTPTNKPKYVQVDLNAKKQPTSLLDSYIPSILQYNYYKQQQQYNANAIKNPIKFAAIEGKTDFIKNFQFAQDTDGSQLNYRLHSYIPQSVKQ